MRHADGAGARRSGARTSYWSIVRVAATATITRPGSSTRRSAPSSESAERPSRRKGSSLPEADCIFCKIVAGEAPATVVNRADGFVAIEDIAPKADTHLLVLPERHIDTFREIGEFPP